MFPELSEWIFDQFDRAGWPVEKIRVFVTEDDKGQIGLRVEGERHGWGRLMFVEILQDPLRLHVREIVV